MNTITHEHEYLGENIYEHLLDEILNWPEWKLNAAIDEQLFSPRTEHKILQYLHKKNEITPTENLDNFTMEPIKPYTKEGAYEFLQKFGILDEVGEITPVFQDIIVREGNEEVK